MSGLRFRAVACANVLTLVFFSVKSQASLKRAKDLMRNERPWFILIGCEIESRSDPEIIHALFTNTTEDEKGPVLPEDGERAAHECRALKYMEYSVENADHLDAIIQEV